MQEPFGAFTWYPANDQPSDEALYDIAVTVPRGLVAVAHGQLDDVDLGEASDTYRWRAAGALAATLPRGGCDCPTRIPRPPLRA